MNQVRRMTIFDDAIEEILTQATEDTSATVPIYKITSYPKDRNIMMPLETLYSR